MTEVLVSPTFQILLANGDTQPRDVDILIDGALAALDARIQRTGKIGSPADAKAHFALHLGRYEHEVFAVLFLDARHRIIAMRDMFHGTLTQASVYPCEIVRHAMLLNAAAVMISHCHPTSRDPTQSRADEALTAAVAVALRLVDIRLLNHFVVGTGSVSQWPSKDSYEPLQRRLHRLYTGGADYQFLPSSPSGVSLSPALARAIYFCSTVPVNKSLNKSAASRSAPTLRSSPFASIASTGPRRCRRARIGGASCAARDRRLTLV